MTLTPAGHLDWSDLDAVFAIRGQTMRAHAGRSGPAWVARVSAAPPPI